MHSSCSTTMQEFSNSCTTLGLQHLDAQKRNDFIEIIEDRHDKHSTIIASQFPVDTWHEIIGEQTIADAILDRMVHNAFRVELKGEYLRRKKQPEKVQNKHLQLQNNVEQE